MNTTVFDVVHLFSQQGISAVPIIDDEGIVINLYETVDVIVSNAPVRGDRMWPTPNSHLFRCPY